MIVSFNFYYALPGKADAVLRQRLHASDVRVQIGLPYGLVLARTASSDALPDVVWGYDFVDRAANAADMAARAASAEFETVRAGMRKLYRRFERPLYENVAPDGELFTLGEGACVALDWIEAEPARAVDIAAVIARQTTPRGRLLRLVTDETNLSAFLWQHAYADAEACERVRATAAARSCSSALAELGRVECSTWRICYPVSE